MDQLTVRPQPKSLPATVQDLEAARKVFHQPTLNDRVDALHVQLWANDEYRRLLDGVYDEDCVEGSCAADNILAAKMLRDHAKTVGDRYVTDKKLATIAKALNVVLKRYGIGRRERAREVAGQLVDTSNSND